MAQFISVQEYKNFANVTTTKTDEQLEAMCAVACVVVESYLNRTFDGATYIARQKVGENRMKVFLRDYDATLGSVDIVLNNTERTVVTLSEEDGTMYFDDYLGYIEVIPHPTLLPIIPNDSIVRVTSTNVDPNDVPEDIKLATYMLVTYYKENHYNKDNVTTTGQTVTFASPTPKNLPNYVRALLSPHRVE